MLPRLTISRLLCVAALALGAAAYGATLKPGDAFPGQTLPDRAGEQLPLHGKADVTVVLFFKAGQEHSNLAAQSLRELRKELEKRSLAWLLVVSDRTPPETVAQLATEFPVGLDTEDALYGNCGIVMEPSAVLLDRAGKVLAFQQFRKVGFQPLLRAEILHALGEIPTAALDAVRHPAPAVLSTDASVAFRRAKLALRLYEAGQFAKALESAQISVERNPTHAEHHLLLGRILAALNRKPEAAAAFREALRLAPDLTAAQQELDRLGLNETPPANQPAK